MQGTLPAGPSMSNEICLRTGSTETRALEIRNDSPIVGSVRFGKISFILFRHLFMAMVSNYVLE
jgi:hypothetical protein